MRTNQIFLLVLFIILTIANLYFAISNPVYYSSCLEGDDIIDDDLCISLEGDTVDMYDTLEERNGGEWMIFTVFEFMFFILLFLISITFFDGV